METEQNSEPRSGAAPGYATDERTCGEMSCDECNDRAAWLRAEMLRLRANAADTSAAFAELASALKACAVVGNDAEMDAYERAKEAVHRVLLKSHNA